jgi:acetylornithine deacetylase/succinyl-diaminopimelate desuccinylase-like protein
MIQMKAAEAMLETGNCPVNLKYLIEGEEEIGSPHLTDFIKAHNDMLAADICVISDTTIKNADQPSLVYSLRGLVTMEVVVTGPKHDLHSGGYGGMIHNPAQAVAEIITELHNDDGSVAVPGFYDNVLDLDESERQELAKGDVTPAEWEAIMGSLPDWGEPGYSKTERTGARPTLEINGVSGGYAGEGFKTVLPARAMAKISCRLVANQDPYAIFEKVSAYIRAVAPPTVHVDIHAHGHGYPALTPLDHPAMQAAKRAYKRNWEADPIYMRGGGSIPVVADFQNLLEIPVVLLGFGLPDCAAHGPNESFDLRMFRKGVDTVIAYMHELADNK